MWVFMDFSCVRVRVHMRSCDVAGSTDIMLCDMVRCDMTLCDVD